MSVKYDGKLILRDKAIEPCCAHMHSMISKGLVKVTATKALQTARLSATGNDGVKVTYPLTLCPVCGAKLEVVQ